MNKFLIALLCLSLMVFEAGAAGPAGAPPAATTPAADAAGDAKGPAPAPGDAAKPEVDKAQYEQAFDGAMTCSALTAIAAQKAPPAEAWRWGNRSFAFGMLAVRFYTESHKEPLKNEDLDGILTQYANALNAMPEAERKQFDEGCGRKYADIDKLCEVNDCPRKPPGAAKSSDEGDAATTNKPNPPAATAPAKP